MTFVSTGFESTLLSDKPKYTHLCIYLYIYIHIHIYPDINIQMGCDRLLTTHRLKEIHKTWGPD